MPLYQHLSENEWQEKINFLKQRFSPCELCPRRCGVLRENDQKGLCGAMKEVKVASANLHYGEEPPITGEKGSGTIFFSGCPMKCVFCQNYPISHLFNGTLYTIPQLADLFLILQKRGAHNLNFVSPSPFALHALQALKIACDKGLSIPIVYNSSGYERWEIIEALDGVVDIYLPDLKYYDDSLAPEFSGVKDYFSHAYPALLEMFHQVGALQVDDNGIAVRGMILRHLLLPGHLQNSKEVLKIIASSPFKTASLSLMGQYFPAYKAVDIPAINRKIEAAEYREIKDYALDLGLEDGWFQDLEQPGKA